MLKTKTGNFQIKDERIKRTHLNVSSPGEAVVSKVVAGNI